MRDLLTLFVHRPFGVLVLLVGRDEHGHGVGEHMRYLPRPSGTLVAINERVSRGG